MGVRMRLLHVVTRMRKLRPSVKRCLVGQLCKARRDFHPQQRDCQGTFARRWWVRPIFTTHETEGAWFTLIPRMREEDSDKFYNFFRQTVKDFDLLLEMVEPHITKQYCVRKPICAGERLAICLRYFATGDNYPSLSFLFRVSDQVISNIVKETSVVIWTLLAPLVFEEFSEEMWLRVAAEYEVLWDFLHCLGGTDGKHFYFKAPPHSGSRYFSYKKRFSFILLAVADAKRKFLMVDAGSSGRRGDGNVFHQSVFGKRLNAVKLNIPPPCPHEAIPVNLPFFFIGDGAFEVGENMVKPFKNVGGITSRPARLFNYRLSRARHCIEDAFDILVQRFEVFKKSMECSKTVARFVTLACCALHNRHLMNEESVAPRRSKGDRKGYCDYYKGGDLIHGRYKHEDPEKELQALTRLFKNVDLAREEGPADEDIRDGETIREVLLDHFINDHAVPWQWEKANLL